MFNGPLGRQVTFETLRTLEIADLPDTNRDALRSLLKSVEQLNAESAGGSNIGRAPKLSFPYEIKEDPVTSRPGIVYNPYAQSFAGMGVQFMLFAAIDAAC